MSSVAGISTKAKASSASNRKNTNGVTPSVLLQWEWEGGQWFALSRVQHHGKPSKWTVRIAEGLDAGSFILDCDNPELYINPNGHTTADLFDCYHEAQAIENTALRAKASKLPYSIQASIREIYHYVKDDLRMVSTLDGVTYRSGWNQATGGSNDPLEDAYLSALEQAVSLKEMLLKRDGPTHSLKR